MKEMNIKDLDNEILDDSYKLDLFCFINKKYIFISIIRNSIIENAKFLLNNDTIEKLSQINIKDLISKNLLKKKYNEFQFNHLMKSLNDFSHSSN
jgi:hypothetical protein